MEPRLIVQDLACRRGDRLLFRGLSFELGPGEALQIVGANGTGKSSLLRILAGLLRAFAGSIDARGDIALLDHTLPLDEHLSLGKALAFWDRLDRGDTQSAARMEALGLGDLRSVPVRYLSAGQRKRAAYLISNPGGRAIWLLDEPLNGLDAAIAGALVAELEAYRARGGIVVVASHQPMPLAGLRALNLSDFAP